MSDIVSLTRFSTSGDDDDVKCKGSYVYVDSSSVFLQYRSNMSRVDATAVAPAALM